MAKTGKDPQQDEQEIDVPQDEVAILQQQVAEKEEARRRALADYRNLQTQVQQERVRLIQMAGAEIVEEMLPTLDHLEMALQHFPDPSLQLIADSFLQVLQRHGLVRIDAVGQAFDPHSMEAVDAAAGNKDEVVAVRRQGYRLNGNVLRHAQVVVGSGK